MAEYGEDGYSVFSLIRFIFMRKTIEILKILWIFVNIF